MNIRILRYQIVVIGHTIIHCIQSKLVNLKLLVYQYILAQLRAHHVMYERISPMKLIYKGPLYLQSRNNTKNPQTMIHHHHVGKRKKSRLRTGCHDER